MEHPPGSSGHLYGGGLGGLWPFVVRQSAPRPPPQVVGDRAVLTGGEPADDAGAGGRAVPGNLYLPRV